MSKRRILVVEDEVALGVIIQEVLEERDCEVSVAATAEDGLHFLEKRPYDVALLDIVLPGMSGLQMLGEVKRRRPDTEVVMMTSHSSVETVIEAIRQGAYDYLEKPFDDIEQIWLCVSRVLEKVELRETNRELLADQQLKNRELSGAVKRLTTFVDAGRAMSEFVSLPELLDFFLGLVTGELEVDRASLMLLDAGTGDLRIAAHRGVDTVPVDEVRVRPGEGIAGTVAQTGRHILVDDMEEHARRGADVKPNLSNSFISAPIVLSIPIKSSEKVLGVINVTNRRTGEPFTQDDLAYVAGMAGQLAVAVERAAQFQTLQEAYDTLRATQLQLVFSERLNVVGQMAAGVAHEFNNALSVILGRAENALERLDPEQDAELERFRRDLEAIVRTSLQGASAIRRVQDYTRIRKDVDRKVVDLNEVVRDSLEMTRPKWKSESESRGLGIDATLELGDAAWVEGNAQELSQVVGNLVFNAVEAMPEGGELGIRCRAEGDAVRLEVSDTGIGMDAKVRDHIFEPFFTTKETGNGLGMSIVYGIITRHGGDIAVESEPDCGTTFRIRFPRSDAAPARHDVDDAPDLARTGRILLVEDDADVRDTFTDALESADHDVTGVHSAEEALRMFSQSPFDLVITDLNMPGMSGADLLRELRRHDPDVPVGVVTGWAAQQDEDRAQLEEAAFVLPKPCRVRDLLRVVESHLPDTTPSLPEARA